MCKYTHTTFPCGHTGPQITTICAKQNELWGWPATAEESCGEEIFLNDEKNPVESEEICAGCLLEEMGGVEGMDKEEGEGKVKGMFWEQLEEGERVKEVEKMKIEEKMKKEEAEEKEIEKEQEEKKQEKQEIKDEKKTDEQQNLASAIIKRIQEQKDAEEKLLEEQQRKMQAKAEAEAIKQKQIEGEQRMKEEQKRIEERRKMWIRQYNLIAGQIPALDGPQRFASPNFVRPGPRPPVHLGYTPSLPDRGYMGRNMEDGMGKKKE
ncbi:hypothetical protein B0T20DRAFT_474425 [Sordaria brevicollis]|uniref:Uncharacterized protein n=1 Tax=Sordaria brevicollis TaxID=83679 RepID=A0AAE0UFV2_SORBR|nr:hypothetical protein B0T20DRAFT_474425 [Sordaria brevicollis]